MAASRQEAKLESSSLQTPVNPSTVEREYPLEALAALAAAALEQEEQEEQEEAVQPVPARVM